MLQCMNQSNLCSFKNNKNSFIFLLYVKLIQPMHEDDFGVNFMK